MYFTGTMSSTTELIASPNTTDELSNEFLESVSIIFKNYSLWDSLEVMLNTFMVYLYGCICKLIFLTLHSELLFSF